MGLVALGCWTCLAVALVVDESVIGGIALLALAEEGIAVGLPDLVLAMLLSDFLHALQEFLHLNALCFLPAPFQPLHIEALQQALGLCASEREGGVDVGEEVGADVGDGGGDLGRSVVGEQTTAEGGLIVDGGERSVAFVQAEQRIELLFHE